MQRAAPMAPTTVAELAPFLPDASDERAATVLSQSVPWESYATSGILTDKDVHLIRRFDKRDRLTQARGAGRRWSRSRAAQ